MSPPGEGFGFCFLAGIAWILADDPGDGRGSWRGGPLMSWLAVLRVAQLAWLPVVSPDVGKQL